VFNSGDSGSVRVQFRDASPKNYPKYSVAPNSDSPAFRQPQVFSAPLKNMSGMQRTCWGSGVLATSSHPTHLPPPWSAQGLFLPLYSQGALSASSDSTDEVPNL
jgi:hypothetical protein